MAVSMLVDPSWANTLLSLISERPGVANTMRENVLEEDTAILFIQFVVLVI